MKVKDLMARLGQLSPELDVVVYSEDSTLLNEGQLYRVLDINDIDTGRAVKDRGPMREPVLRFEQSPAAVEIAFIHVVADF